MVSIGRCLYSINKSPSSVITFSATELRLDKVLGD